MKIKITYFFICLVVAFNSFGQAEKSDSLRLDSLQRLVNNATGRRKLDLILKMAQLKISDNKGIEYSNKAIQIAKDLDDIAKFDAQIMLANVYSNLGQNDKTLAALNKSLEISQKSKYSNGALRSLKGLMLVYYYSDSLKKAEEFANKLYTAAIDVDSASYSANALFYIGLIYKQRGNLDTSLVLLNNELKIWQKVGNKSEMASVYYHIGQNYFEKGDLSKAYEYFLKDIELRETLEDPKKLAISILIYGENQLNESNYNLALFFFEQAVRVLEKLDDQWGIATAYNYMGQACENLSYDPMNFKENETNYRKALDYYFKALSIFKTVGQKANPGNCLKNIGNTYSKIVINHFMNKYGFSWTDSLNNITTIALKDSFRNTIGAYQQSISMLKETNDTINYAHVCMNLGSTYNYTRDWDMAEKYLREGISIARKPELYNLRIVGIYSLGFCSFYQGNYSNAESFFNETYQYGKINNIKDIEGFSAEMLSKIAEIKGEYKKSLDNLKQTLNINEFLYSEKAQNLHRDLQLLSEQKQRAEKKVHDKELQEQLVKRQRLILIVTFFVVGTFLLLLVIILFIRLYFNKRKANRVLVGKNALIAQQKQEITDSIVYASNIQSALLPSSEILDTLLDDYFVIYMPKNILSGDFYWSTQVDSKTIVVAADCTGHGVPGAMMSMLGISFLQEIVMNKKVVESSLILNLLREYTKKALYQTGKKQEQKDGMDISFCIIDKAQMQLDWAGAYNPLYLVRDDELIEYKADKMPIAIHINDNMPFTNHLIKLQKGDSIYLFSDGYIDQFGGVEGRKFMSKRFKDLLLSNSNKPMDEQKKIIYQTHVDWKGEREQVDDILVIGVRI